MVVLSFYLKKIQRSHDRFPNDRTKKSSPKIHISLFPSNFLSLDFIDVKKKIVDFDFDIFTRSVFGFCDVIYIYSTIFFS